MKKITIALLLLFLMYSLTGCFSTEKKNITITAEDMVVEYNGSHITFEYDVLENVNIDVKYYTYDDNVALQFAPVEVGKYRVNLSFTGSSLYNSLYTSYIIEIVKPLEQLKLKNMVVNYTGQPVTYILDETELDYTIQYSVKDANTFSSNAPTEVGTYDIKVVLGENEKYASGDYYGMLTILSNDELVYHNVNVEYTGEKVVFEVSNGETVLYSLKGENDFTSNAPTSVGQYDVLVKSEGETISYCYYSLVIEKRSLVVTASNITVTYSGEAVNFDATANYDVKLKYQYSVSGENNFTNNPPVNVGKYDVCVSYDGDEINGSITKYYTIEILAPDKEFEFLDSEIDYSENTNIILNPEKGFYQAVSEILPTDSSEALWSIEEINHYAKSFSVFHLRLGLENFSKNAGGSDINLTDTALKCLENTLTNFRNCNTSVIIRFSYNVEGTTVNNKYIEAEPALSLVLKHVQQISTVINKFKDVIASVETGMLGPWGEQHSTTLGSASSSNAHTYYSLVEEWLKNLDSKITVTVRRPLYFIYWANERYSLELTTSNMSKYNYDSLNSADVYRVGCYNDGYLGSSSDLGTYSDRTEEVNWLFKQATKTLFGGEVVADRETDGIGEFNNVTYLETEGYLTHTTYLNYAWNYTKVIARWEENTYSGSNTVYSGKTNEYAFVANHLGYNFWLKKSEVGSIVVDDKLYLRGEIVNNGFGNVVNQKKVEVVLTNGTNTYYYDVDLDIRDILSKDTYSYNLTLDLKHTLTGKYDIYLKISDIDELSVSNLRTIRFANLDKYWSEELGANYLGSIN